MPGRSKIRVGILFGGPSSEHEVSIASGKMVLKHINRGRYYPVPIELRRSLQGKIGFDRKWLSFASVLEHLHKCDVIFLALHGAFGEDGKIQAILEALDVPYIGSGPASSAMAMNKNLTNLVFQSAGFSVPDWQLINQPKRAMRLPLIIKPNGGGSSVDTFLVKTWADYSRAIRRVINKYHQALIQDYVSGREITCGVLEKNGQAFALPPTEIIPKSMMFDYHAKYTPGGSQEITPAKLTKAQILQAQDLALKAHSILGCRGMSRVDFIFHKGKFWILEVNTLPGLTQTSLFPQAAAAAGITFSKLIDILIHQALSIKKAEPLFPKK